MKKYVNFLICFVLGAEPGGATADIARQRRHEFGRFKLILKGVLVGGALLAIWLFVGFDVPE